MSDNRQLKKLVEAYWAGKISEAELMADAKVRILFALIANILILYPLKTAS